MRTHDGVETLIATMSGTLMALAAAGGRPAERADTAAWLLIPAAVQPYAIGHSRSVRKSFNGRAVKVSLSS